MIFSESGIQVCEVGCGVGNFMSALAKTYPNTTFVGFDIGKKDIEEAKRRNTQHNVEFFVHDMAKLPREWNSSFDYVYVIDVLHDTYDPKQSIKHILKIIKPQGLISLVDLNNHSAFERNKESPYNSVFYACSLGYCLPSAMYQGNGDYAKGGQCYGQEQFLEDLKELDLTIVKETTVPNQDLQIHIIGQKTNCYD